MSLRAPLSREKRRGIKSIAGYFILVILGAALIACRIPTGCLDEFGEDGVCVIWKGSYAGEKASALADPLAGWAYYNTTDGNS
jgi:hypothetical protein